jgi:hypothetical protein
MLPGNTFVTVREDFRFYPAVRCSLHPRGYMLISRKGKTVSFKTEAGAERYLLRTFGSDVVCPIHGKAQA